MGHLALRVAATYWPIKCSNDSKPLHSPSSYIRQVYAKAPTSVADLKVVFWTRVEGSDFRVFSRAPVGFSVSPPQVNVGAAPTAAARDSGLWDHLGRLAAKERAVGLEIRRAAVWYTTRPSRPARRPPRAAMLQGLLWAVVGANAAGSGYKFAGEAYPKIWPAAALVWARKLPAGGPGTKPG